MRNDSMLSLKQLLHLIPDGSAHVMLTDAETGEVLISSIWWDDLAHWAEHEVCSIKVQDYQLILGVKKV